MPASSSAAAPAAVATAVPNGAVASEIAANAAAAGGEPGEHRRGGSPRAAKTRKNGTCATTCAPACAAIVGVAGSGDHEHDRQRRGAEQAGERGAVAALDGAEQEHQQGSGGESEHASSGWVT